MLTPQKMFNSSRDHTSIASLFRYIFLVPFHCKLKTIWPVTVGGALWSVWLARCENVFNGKAIIVKELVFLTKLRSLFWIKTAKDDCDFDINEWWTNPASIIKPCTPTRVDWSPPTPCSLKFNIDRVAKGNKIVVGVFSGMRQEFCELYSLNSCRLGLGFCGACVYQIRP
ncbi:hypothetical protein V6N12_055786 [Hibiscus sabdariffa]|uniref:Uncharacterized protein n=1 Tax=Hibiscus sabdariffa TaxID=183260 RepID=A0ABR2AJT2_9ROSI